MNPRSKYSISRRAHQHISEAPSMCMSSLSLLCVIAASHRLRHIIFTSEVNGCTKDLLIGIGMIRSRKEMPKYFDLMPTEATAVYLFSGSATDVPSVCTTLGRSQITVEPENHR
ncbi:hypothetical protein BDV96DRAFT_595438 [Lophiotrema nucula]|uniref:Uncharacterized protein n=1 Tax=Lophiotrema nucula TaxID=690887 RepID=A0A6A5ZLD2_9PLEO|nr:hypothetical protein BDV96DRAFT_595438 [Lophiotrema nucula]